MDKNIIFGSAAKPKSSVADNCMICYAYPAGDSLSF